MTIIRSPIYFAAAAALMASLVGCGETAAPNKIEEISSAILTSTQEVVNGKSTLTISIKQDSIFSGGNTTKAVLAGLMKHFQSKQFDQVIIVMNEEMVDKYGKELREPILELTFPRAELVKINFDNILGWGVLNLSEPRRVGNHAASIVERECAEENNAKYAAVFCGNALR